MNEITLCAYAKVNLHLEITGVQENGYHTVESIMQSISLADILTLKKTDSQISLSCSDPLLSCGEDNLVFRAARAFFEKTRISGGASINLIKRIPMQAGLGGGSSDAATTLRGLNLLYRSPLTEEALLALGATLGADVPFCLRGRSALATGIGTELSDAPPLPPCHLVICMGAGDKMSTRDAYSALDTINLEPQEYRRLFSALSLGDFEGVCSHLFNRFTCLNPNAAKGMDKLRSLGAKGTLLCGSGAAFFGLFAPEDEALARDAKERMIEEGYRAWNAVPIG